MFRSRYYDTESQTLYGWWTASLPANGPAGYLIIWPLFSRIFTQNQFIWGEFG